MTLADVALNALVALAIFAGLVFVMGHRHHDPGPEREPEKK